MKDRKLPHGLDGEYVFDLDHIIKWSDGGGSHPLNLQALCSVCHDIKSRAEQKKLAEVQTPASAYYAPGCFSFGLL